MTNITDTLARLNALHRRMIDGHHSSIAEQQSFFDEWPAIAAHIAAQDQRIADLVAERDAARAEIGRLRSGITDIRTAVTVGEAFSDDENPAWREIINMIADILRPQIEAGQHKEAQ